MSELFPEPEAPVTHTNCSSGISTSMFLRLFWRAPRTTSDLQRDGRRCAGMAMLFLPLRYWPVSERPSFSSFFKDPSATMVPPCTPGPGPISRMIRGANRVGVMLDHDDRVAEI